MSVSSGRMRRGRTLPVLSECGWLIELVYWVLSLDYVLGTYGSLVLTFFSSGVGVGSRMGFFMYCGYTVIHQKHSYCICRYLRWLFLDSSIALIYLSEATEIIVPETTYLG
jgi:hypothetical protein